ncbi:MAG: LPS export ABC transporter periplasmic protein LptC [Magnetococcus sp. DMHC-8]
MKTPAKALFVALPVLVVGAVVWHLQHPSQVIPGEEPCHAPAHGGGKTDATPVPAGTACRPARSAMPARAMETRVTQVRLVQFEGDRTRWTMNAPGAHNDGEERIVVQQPDLTIYANDGQISSITSDEGFMESRSGQEAGGPAMVFTGHVVAKNEIQQLSTEILRFDPDARTLHTDQPFVLVNEGVRLEGVGLTLYQETQKLIVPHRVRVHHSTTQEGVYREKAGSQPRRS